MRVLIVGAGGYLGIPLCEALAWRHYDVVAADRWFFGKKPELGEGKCVNFDTRFSDLPPGNFDAVIDLAGLSNDATSDVDPALTHDINTVGGARLASMAKSAGVRRYIYSSSASVYGRGGKMNLTEDDAPNPLTAYAKSKLLVENHVRSLASSTFEPVILRNATVFGVAPRMRFDLAVNIMTMRAIKEGLIYVMGGGEQWRPFVHVDDVVRAFVLALEMDATAVAGQVFNIGFQRLNMQIKQLAYLVRWEIPTAQIHSIPDEADRRSYHVSFDKAERLLGFTGGKSVVQGIRQISGCLAAGKISGDDPTTNTLAWYKSIITWGKRIDGMRLDGHLL